VSLHPATSRQNRSQRRARTATLPGLLALLGLLASLLVIAPAQANTSHAGWPTIQKLIMDKGPAGESHVLQGVEGVHNELLGGYGNDTIYGGNGGDVLWADYHPGGVPNQVSVIHGGNGKNFIYADHAVSTIWTGTDPETVVHAHEGSGTIYCGNPHIIVYTSHHALPHYKLHGCKRISFYSVGY
jgi:Ca2+-binding RTX toxin-like protein